MRTPKSSRSSSAPALALVALLLAPRLVALEDKGAGDAAAWVPLFNGQDLSGWVPVNVAPETFSVRDGIIVSTGVPTGVMRSERQYENFILELEWRHMKAGGNAGLFIWSDPETARGQPFCRAIEVQILDGRESESYTSHGDVFSIHGARMKPDRPHPGGWERCLPSEKRCKPAGEWNHYRVTCKDGVLKLAVNGKEVSGGSGCTPRKGYLCLEAEGSECHFRNLRIQELPSSGAGPENTAALASGFRSLYTGLDLRGWKADEGHKGHWNADNWVLKCDGKSAEGAKRLLSAEAFGDCDLICDWRMAKAGESAVQLGGERPLSISISAAPTGSGGLSSEVQVVPPQARADQALGQWNRFEISRQGEELSVRLNGQLVIDRARVSLRGRVPIGLADLGSPVEFANVYVREANAKSK